MITFFNLLARPVIDAAVSAFGNFLLGMFQTWQTAADNQALGRASAERDAAIASIQITQEFEAVPLPTQSEAVNALRNGAA